MKRFIVLCALFAGAAPAAQQGSVAQATLAANKQLINDFFNFRGAREERAQRFMADAYIQHNPRFLKMDTYTGKHGWQAWVAANDEATRRGGLRLVDLGGIALRNPIILTAEGDLALAVYRGLIPDPDNPGQRYEAFAFEAFRFRDGKFIEHWDQVRLKPGWMTPPPAPAPAPAAAAPAGGAAAQLAVPAAPAVQALPAAGCVSSPETLSVNRQLIVSLERASRRGLSRELVIAECDFASIVWKQTLPDPDQPERRWEAFTFDTYRIRDGRLIEHWDESTR